jgi:hypothetical protein
MDQQTAEIVQYVITGVAVIVWLLALQFLVNSYRKRRRAGEQAAEQLGMTEQVPENLICGSAEVQGQPAELATKAATLLARSNVKIMESTPERVAFEGFGAPMGGQPQGRTIGQGQLRFAPAGKERTRIDYAVEMSGGKGLLWGGGIFLAVGFVAIIVGFVLIRVFVVDNPNPEIRWQVFQMVQVSHFVWPPFLFGGLYRMSGRMIRNSFEVLVHNLPYHAA